MHCFFLPLEAQSNIRINFVFLESGECESNVHSAFSTGVVSTNPREKCLAFKMVDIPRSGCLVLVKWVYKSLFAEKKLSAAAENEVDKNGEFEPRSKCTIKTKQRTERH